MYIKNTWKWKTYFNVFWFEPKYNHNIRIILFLTIWIIWSQFFWLQDYDSCSGLRIMLAFWFWYITDNKLRLIGNTTGEGRLEIHHEGQWGTICYNGWDDDGAAVACRQLGFLWVFYEYCWGLVSFGWMFTVPFLTAFILIQRHVHIIDGWKPSRSWPGKHALSCQLWTTSNGNIVSASADVRTHLY